MSKVEDWFITPLEAHFESQPTDGARDTILTDMEPYSADDLNTAVEWLKRARQAQKTFPSPKECIKAIKAVVGGRSDPVVIKGSTITAENYAANAVAFCAGKTDIPVIHHGQQQWDEWIAYYEWLKVHWVLAIVRERKSWTVPALFPSTFDPRFVYVARQEGKQAA